MSCSYRMLSPTSCHSFPSEEDISFRWVIHNAEKVLVQTSQQVNSTYFPGTKLINNSQMSAQWIRDVPERVQPGKLSLVLYFSHSTKIVVSNLHFILSGSLSTKIVKTEDKIIDAHVSDENPYVISCLKDNIVVPENESIKNYLNEGIMILEVSATFVRLPPCQSISDLPVITEHELGKNMYKLFQDDIFTDLTILTRGKTFRVHKVVLASQSKVFERMLEADMCEKHHGEVVVSDITPDVMEDLLTYFYTGTAPNIKSLARDLLLAADKYDLLRLRVLAENELMMSLTCNNVTSVVCLADKVQQIDSSKLRSVCIEYFKKHSDTVRKTVDYAKNVNRLSEELISLLLE